MNQFIETVMPSHAPVSYEQLLRIILEQGHDCDEHTYREHHHQNRNTFDDEPKTAWAYVNRIMNFQIPFTLWVAHSSENILFIQVLIYKSLYLQYLIESR